jgi:hypothetical protein
MAITHTKVSEIEDGGDAALVLPSDWNANHTLGADDNLLTDAQVAALHPAVTLGSHTDHFLTLSAGQVLDAPVVGINKVLAGPTSGAAANADWRVLTSADISDSHAAVSVSAPLAKDAGQALSLVNDAAATITQIDTAALSALDTDIPTSKAVGTAITTHAALRTGVHGIGAGVMILPQGNPIAESTGAITIHIADMLTGIVTGNPSAARAYTLDSGANCDAGVTMSNNEAFDWVLININTTAANIITLTSPGADHTIVGSTKVPANSTTTGNLWGTSGALLRTRKTAANTFITYRIG